MPVLYFFLNIGSSFAQSHAPIAMTVSAMKNAEGGRVLKIISERKTPMKGAMA